eukprot:10574-Heterococcus_DN1.PRE.7
MAAATWYTFCCTGLRQYTSNASAAILMLGDQQYRHHDMLRLLIQLAAALRRCIASAWCSVTIAAVTAAAAIVTAHSLYWYHGTVQCHCKETWQSAVSCPVLARLAKAGKSQCSTCRAIPRALLFSGSSSSMYSRDKACMLVEHAVQLRVRVCARHVHVDTCVGASITVRHYAVQAGEHCVLYISRSKYVLQPVIAPLYTPSCTVASRRCHVTVRPFTNESSLYLLLVCPGAIICIGIQQQQQQAQQQRRRCRSNSHKNNSTKCLSSTNKKAHVELYTPILRTYYWTRAHTGIVYTVHVNMRGSHCALSVAGALADAPQLQTCIITAVVCCKISCLKISTIGTMLRVPQLYIAVGCLWRTEADSVIAMHELRFAVCEAIRRVFSLMLCQYSPCAKVLVLCSEQWAIELRQMLTGCIRTVLLIDASTSALLTYTLCCTALQYAVDKPAAPTAALFIVSRASLLTQGVGFTTAAATVASSYNVRAICNPSSMCSMLRSDTSACMVQRHAVTAAVVVLPQCTKSSLCCKETRRNEILTHLWHGMSSWRSAPDGQQWQQQCMVKCNTTMSLVTRQSETHLSASSCAVLPAPCHEECDVLLLHRLSRRQGVRISHAKRPSNLCRKWMQQHSVCTNCVTILWQTGVIMLTELLSAAVASVSLVTTDRTACGRLHNVWAA